MQNKMFIRHFFIVKIVVLYLTRSQLSYVVWNLKTYKLEAQSTGDRCIEYMEIGISGTNDHMYSNLLHLIINIQFVSI